jgi:hypothetical protein
MPSLICLPFVEKRKEEDQCKCRQKTTIERKELVGEGALSMRPEARGLAQHSVLPKLAGGKRGPAGVLCT